MISSDAVVTTGDAAIDAIVSRALASPAPMLERIDDDAGPMPDKSDRAKVLEVLKRWGVPKRLVRELPQVDRTRPAISEVIAWGKGDLWSLQLGGAAGIGKSMAAAYWLAGRARSFTGSLEGLKTCWYQANDLTHIDRDEYRRLWRAPRLVIDDLGAEYIADSGYFYTVLYSILSHRYDDELKTIVTTNLDAEALKARFADMRLLRRLSAPYGANVWLGATNA